MDAIIHNLLEPSRKLLFHKQAVGLEILRVDDLGRVSPGKDCPELTRNKFMACREMVPRRRLKWAPVLIKDEECGSRKWTQGPAAGRRN